VGNGTFAVGLGSLFVAITIGIQPYHGHAMGWTSPEVLALLGGGLALLAAFVVIETRVAEPMFQLSLFRIRAFTAGNVASFAARLGQGGSQFMLVIWLQGIWLPLHGYDFSSTPLWAGVFLLPLTAGFLVSGPLSGHLSDRFGARGFATAGMVIYGLSFLALLSLPVDFNYLEFGVIIAINGIGIGMFSAPNTSSMMSAVPPEQRGVASGMRATFQNSGTALSIGVFFSLMITGLASSLPKSLTSGLEGQGVTHAVAHRVASLPPVSSLFSSVLGVNPLQHLLSAAGALSSLPAEAQSVLTGRQFFPDLLASPFQHGLTIVFGVSAALAFVSAIASSARGRKPARTTQDDRLGDAEAEEAVTVGAEPWSLERLRLDRSGVRCGRRLHRAPGFGVRALMPSHYCFDGADPTTYELTFSEPSGVWALASADA
jgi:MFS family permease